MFHSPKAVFPGPDLEAAETLARSTGGWLAGGLEYGPAESPGPGWWGVFDTPLDVTWTELQAWADPAPVKTSALTSSISQDEYRQAFQQVRQALEDGLTYQVNLTFLVAGRAVSAAEWTWRSALRLWLDLVSAQGREASFAVLGTPDSPAPVLVSASPELFFERHGDTVEARPMKGTALRDPDPTRDAEARQDLATHPKPRAENLMVTDMLRNDLGRWAVPGGVSVPRLFEVEAYPTVWQMTSTVRAELVNGVTLTTLMRALFPCASITGAPKVSTQSVIEKTEVSPRGWYTGTLGWYRPGSVIGGPERGRFSVLIRTLVFHHNAAEFSLGIGGGVVWDSTAEGEWDEAWAKTRFLTSTQRDFSLTEAVLWEPQGGLFLLPEHEKRLAEACRVFGGTLDRKALRALLDAEVVLQKEERGNTGALKLRVLVGPDWVLRVESEELRPLPEVLSAALAENPLGPESLLWRRYKTTDRRIYDQGRVAGVDQTIHYNERGELTESTSMTLVLEKEGRFLTPALSSGLLDGTYRARLIAEGTLVETVLPIEALRTADRIWLVNSVRRWCAVQLVSETKKGPP